MSILNRRYYGDGRYAPRGPFVLNKDSLQAQGLVGWWPVIGDALGNVKSHALQGGHKLTFSSGVTKVATVFVGKGLDFQSDNQTGLSDDGAILSDWPVTLTSWVNPRNITNNHGLIGIVNDADHANFLAQLDLPGGVGGDPARAFVRDSSGAFRAASSSNGFLANKANFVFGSFNSVGHKRVILNGDVGNAGSETTTESLPTVNATNFGHLGDLSSTEFANAILWDLRVYNRDLPDSFAVHMWEPSTRWDLYYETGRVLYFFAPVAVGGANPHNPLGHPLIGPFGGPV